MLPALAYDPAAPELPSAGFIVTPAVGGNSSSSATPPATSGTSPPSTSGTSTQSTSPSPPPSDAAVGLTAGAKAGIGVGIALGVVGVGALVAVLFLQRRGNARSGAAVRRNKRADRERLAAGVNVVYPPAELSEVRSLVELPAARGS
jgi:hypothetical protein